jgi:hypothetical protein
MLSRMNRRRFLQMLGLGVTGLAVEQAIPFGRVWSFPKEIFIPNPAAIATFSDDISWSIVYRYFNTATGLSDRDFISVGIV